MKIKNESVSIDVQNSSLEKPSKLDKVRILKKGFWTSIGAIAAYKLFDQGLADLLNLETLRHGTDPRGFAGINLRGADPSYGGNHTGSCYSIASQRFIERSKNFFYVFKDTGFDVGNPIYSAFLKPLQPRLHAVLSGATLFGSSYFRLDSKPFATIAGAFAGAFTPTLKFRFRPEDVLGCQENCRFESDPYYDEAGKMAYRTSQPISAIHLGVLGSVTQGINKKTVSRMASNLLKVLKGCALLFAAYKAARTTYSYFKQKEAPPESTKSQPKPTWVQTTRKVCKSCAWGCIAAAVLVI